MSPMALQIEHMSGLQKAAILLLLLGDDAASSVYKNLPDEELQRLTEEIAGLDNVQPEIADQVLREYYRLSLTQDYLAQGGPDVAQKMLTAAFGEQAAKALLSDVLRSREAIGMSLESLQRADPAQLVKFVQGEHPQTIAMILAHLGANTATALLAMMPEKVRGQAVRRLAEMQQFSPEMVQKISQVLHKRVQSLGEQSRRSYGGIRSAADLLNRLPPETSKSILESVEGEDAKLALSIRNLMFTFEDFISVPETNVRDLLTQVDKKGLAMALKGAGEELRNHFFKTMSSRAVEMLKEDMEALGPVRAQVVSTAQQEIVAAARRLEAEGKISLQNNGEESFIV